HHAMVRVHEGRVQVRDLESRNGTLVNGKPITEVVIAVGDRVQLGRTTMQLREDLDATLPVEPVADRTGTGHTDPTYVPAIDFDGLPPATEAMPMVRGCDVCGRAGS